MSTLPSLLLMLMIVFGSLVIGGTNDYQQTTDEPEEIIKEAESCPEVPGGFRAEPPVETDAWGSLRINVGYLPQDSCYRPLYPTKGGYEELRLYPKIEANDLVGPYSLEVSVQVLPTDSDEPPAISCSTPVGYDDLRDEEFINGPYTITVMERLDYTYDGGPYSNPNPYTPELKDTVLKVFRSIKIGDCK